MATLRKAYGRYKYIIIIEPCKNSSQRHDWSDVFVEVFIQRQAGVEFHYYAVGVVAVEDDRNAVLNLISGS